jgi:hypothetical protein
MLPPSAADHLNVVFPAPFIFSKVVPDYRSGRVVEETLALGTRDKENAFTDSAPAVVDEVARVGGHGRSA